MEGLMAFCFKDLYQEIGSGVGTYWLSFEALCNFSECCRGLQAYRLHGLVSQQRMQSWFEYLFWAGNHRKAFQYLAAISVPMYKALQNQLLPLRVHQQQHQAGGFGKLRQTNDIQRLLFFFLCRVFQSQLWDISCSLYLVQIGWFALHWQRLRNTGKDWKGFFALDLLAAHGKIV